jgi:hypothetical protein
MFNVAEFREWLLDPPITAVGEDRLEMTCEDSAGVLDVPFGIGPGGGDALKRFVENADDPQLFGKWRRWDGDT